jgi:hypothetical protein
MPIVVSTQPTRWRLCAVGRASPTRIPESKGQQTSVPALARDECTVAQSMDGQLPFTIHLLEREPRWSSGDPFHY